MKRKIISATLGTILCLGVTAPASAQGETASGGIVQAIYSVIASWLLGAEVTDGTAEKSPQIIYEPALLAPSALLGNEPGDGPEMTPIIVPTG